MTNDEPKLLYGAPIVPVKNVERSVSFYVETLSFEIVHWTEDNSFAVVRRGPVHIQLIACDDQAVLAITGTNIAMYVEVEGVDALYERLKPRLDLLPGGGRVRAPFDQDYGMREFHVKDPDGMLLFFGEAI